MKSKGLGSSSTRASVGGRTEGDAGKGRGEGGRGAEPPSISASGFEEDEDKSTEASDALSTGDSTACSGGKSKGAGDGDGADTGDGSGGKAGEASSGSSGFRPRVGKGADGMCMGKSGSGTDVPRASGCSGRKPARM